MNEIQLIDQNLCVGPFSKDNFDQSKWEKVKHHISLINSITADINAILPYCRLFLQILKELNASPNSNEYFGECTIKEFFFNQFLTLNTKSIINYKYLWKNHELERVLDNCLQQFIFFWVRIIPDDVLNITKMAEHILYPNCKYYVSSSSKILPKSKIETKEICYESRKYSKVVSFSASALFAIKKSNQNCTNAFVNLVNYFGMIGGFEKIYQRIFDRNNWASINIVTMLCCIVGNLCPVLSRESIHKYIPKFKQAVCDNLLENPNSRLGGLTKIKFSLILQSLNIFSRCEDSEKNARESLEIFSLRICEILINSESYENQIQGLYIFFKLIRNSISQDNLREFLQKNNIFDKVYSPLINPEVTKRSEYLFRYFLQQNMITSKELDKLWEIVMTGGVIVSKAICKILSNSSRRDIGPNHLDYLISKTYMVPKRSLTEDHIRIVFGLSKSTRKSPLFCKEVLEFCWNIILNTDGIYSANMVELTTNNFWTMIKDFKFKVYDMEILYKSIENLEKKIHVLDSIQLIKILIEKYPRMSPGPINFTQEALIDHLYKKMNLPNLLLKELKSFKLSLEKNTNNKEKVSEEFLKANPASGSSYSIQITKRIKFFQYIMRNTFANQNIFPYNFMCEVWDTLVMDALLSLERKIGLEVINLASNLIHYIASQQEHLLKFFIDKLESRQFLDSNILTDEGFNCFKHMFLAVNTKLNQIYKKLNAKVGLSEIIGLEGIWDFIYMTDSHSALASAFKFYIDVYYHIDIDFSALKAQKFNEICVEELGRILENKSTYSKEMFTRECLRCLRLLALFIDESEQKGIGEMVSHCPLPKAKPLTIRLDFGKVSIKTHGSTQINIKVLEIGSNMTLFNLRLEVAKMINSAWDELDLAKHMEIKAISHHENGKTLQEIDLKDGELLIVHKRHILEENLLEESGGFRPVAKHILIKLFAKYSDDGKMSPEQYALFIHSYSNDMWQINDQRVKSAFIKFNKDRDCFLKEDDFLELYLDLYRSRKIFVFMNLNAHGYRRDLKNRSEVQFEKADQTSLLRYIISHNDEYFLLLFSLLQLENEEVAHEAWKILSRMPTNPRMFFDVVMLKGVRNSTENPKWNELLDPKSNYRLLYLLYIVENLLDEKITEKEIKYMEQMLSSQDPKVHEYKSKWRYDFAAYGGVEHLFNILHMLLSSESANLSTCDKSVLSLVLRILQEYLRTILKNPSFAIDLKTSSIQKLALLFDFSDEEVDKQSNHGAQIIENSKIENKYVKNFINKSDDDTILNSYSIEKIRELYNNSYL